ncbi:hypothetical protein PVL29_011710 [Vitis rotundifolia]|uniref:Uncharacterized protein n=1 Tax=Vitis rotundifolia TaxID=103349 RepID=A0AA39DQT6_VITRO|nr:hypothetical protein PVL29_011710 [Vitis rotundifolia]
MGSSLAQLEILYLDSCLRYPCLPPLGQLHVLDKLFLGSPSTVFPKLKELAILRLDELKQWEIKQKEERSIMPCLKSLAHDILPKAGGTAGPCAPEDTIAEIGHLIFLYYGTTLSK